MQVSVTAGVALLALTRLYFWRKVASRLELRPLGRIRHRLGQFVKKLVELRSRVKIHWLRQIILRPVIPNLVPLAIAPLRIGPGIVPKDKTNRRHPNPKKGIMVRPLQEPALRLLVRPQRDAHAAAHRPTVSPRVVSSIARAVSSFSGNSGRNWSRLISATSFATGTVG